MKTMIQILVLLVLAMPVQAQQQRDPMTHEEKKLVIDSLSKLLQDNYIFPEKAEAMVSLIQSRFEDEHYQTNDPAEFSQLITEDLRSINHDLHLHLNFDPDMVSEISRSTTSEDSAEIAQLRAERSLRSNYGFEEVKMLSTGVGYLKLDGFSGAPKAGETAAAAMAFLSGSKALIIDLRENGGGSPDMIQFLSTYLFGPNLVHLNSFYDRPSDATTQRWTLPYVPGKRLSNANVYILTSGNTFSAAEEFTYNLKNLERAQIIGETTGGGAHPGGFMPTSERFAVWMPSGRAINPITGTNWEGVGVTPDISVPANRALEKAHYLAVKELSEAHGSGDNPYQWTEARLKALASPCTISPESIGEYVGNYGPRQISAESGKLYYQRDQRQKYQLKCMSDDLFMIEELPYFRLRFIREGEKVSAVEGLYENGHKDVNRKVISP